MTNRAMSIFIRAGAGYVFTPLPPVVFDRQRPGTYPGIVSCWPGKIKLGLTMLFAPTIVQTLTP